MPAASARMPITTTGMAMVWKNIVLPTRMR